MPLIIILVIVYKGFLSEMFKDYKHKTNAEILEEGKYE